MVQRSLNPAGAKLAGSVVPLIGTAGLSGLGRGMRIVFFDLYLWQSHLQVL
jgi:hypothetical protein